MAGAAVVTTASNSDTKDGDEGGDSKDNDDDGDEETRVARLGAEAGAEAGRVAGERAGGKAGEAAGAKAGAAAAVAALRQAAAAKAAKAKRAARIAGEEAGTVIEVHNEQDFDRRVGGAAKERLVVVDFSAQWCGPCKMIAPFVASLADKNRDVTFLGVDEAAARSLVEGLGVRAFPTFMFFIAGERVAKMEGADRAGLEERVFELSARAKREAGVTLEPWSCGLCGIDNMGESPKCVACDATKGAWRCACTVVNPAEQSACTVCGSGRAGGAGIGGAGAPEPWTCWCSTINDASASICRMCQQARPKDPNAADEGAEDVALGGPAPPRCTVCTSVPASKPAYVVFTDNWAGATFESLTDGALFTSPAALVARSGVIAYIAGMRKGTEPVFKFPHNWVWSSCRFPMLFMKELLDRLGFAGRLPPQSPFADPVDIRGSPSGQEIRVSWLMYNWEGPDARPLLPEFNCLRNVALMYRVMTMADPYQRYIRFQMWSFMMGFPQWPQLDVIEGNGSPAIDGVHMFNNQFKPWDDSRYSKATAKVTDPHTFLDDAGSLPAVVTEDDVLHSATVNPFETRPNNATFAQEEAEEFVTYLTAPYVRISLILDFIAHDRLGALFNPTVARIVERCLLEPLAWYDASHLAERELDVVPCVPLPARDRQVLGTRYGVLMNELQHAPAGVVRPLLALANSALEMCTDEGYSGNRFVKLELWLARLVVAVERSIVFLLHHSSGAPGTRDLGTPTRAVPVLSAMLLELRSFTLGPLRSKVMTYESGLGSAQKQTNA